MLCPTAGARADEVQSRDGLGPPTAQELRMMGANTSISFKKQRSSGLPRPLTTLPPFVPRLFIEDCMLNNDKFKGFDAAGRDLTAASKTLKPSVIELQAALMIADVTGFTQLTEILSKKGACGRVGGPSREAEEQGAGHGSGSAAYACMPLGAAGSHVAGSLGLWSRASCGSRYEAWSPSWVGALPPYTCIPRGGRWLVPPPPPAAHPPTCLPSCRACKPSSCLRMEGCKQRTWAQLRCPCL